MSADIERRPLTDLLKTTMLDNVVVNNQPVKVGLSVQPEGSGWHGQPNAPGSEFLPYLVLHAQTAVPHADAGSIADPQGDWHFPYVVQCYGVTHDQCEWMADRARTSLKSLRNEIVQLGTFKYKVSQVWTSQIGGVDRVPGQDPPTYVQQDGVALWMAKRRTP